MVRSVRLHSRLRYDADTDIAFNQPANRIEAAQLHAQTQWAANAVCLVRKEALDRAGAIEPHHVVVEYFGKRDTRTAGEWMVLCDHQDEAVAAEWKRIKPTVVDGAGNDADVGIAFGDQPNNLVA